MGSEGIIIAKRRGKRALPPGFLPMSYRDFRKTNHPAIAGFLLPFVAAGLASITVLCGQRGLSSFWARICFFVLIPLTLILGLFCSIRSIPRISDRGDKDYAYSGLVLNVFFILLYIGSGIYMMASFTD